MNWVAWLRVPSKLADEVTDLLWSQGLIVGVEELPNEDALLFPVGQDFEVLEFGSEAAKKCLQFLQKGHYRNRELILKLYLPDVVEGQGQTAVVMDAASVEKSLAQALGSLGKKTTFLKLEALPSTDYLEEYKKNVRGVSFGENLWMGPPWDRAPESARHAFIVEPGLAFGTGDHPTTQLCVERLEAWTHDSWSPGTVLDLGTGSGILAVAVKKFFPKAKVWAADLDPLCTAEVHKTLKWNGLEVSDLQAVWCGPDGDLRRIAATGMKFDLVVSNIYAEVLAGLVPTVLKILAPGGRWLVSGVLEGTPEKILLEAIDGKLQCSTRTFRAKSSALFDHKNGLTSMDEVWTCWDFC